jgi:CDP-6-deoxy-D-xylo-4-hexulose-3-dehydrase
MGEGRGYFMKAIAPAPAVKLDWPLMWNNIRREDLDAAIQLLSADPATLVLTQSREVARFEEEWSRWLGVRHSVFVNSGSSANLLSLAALQQTAGPGEVIVPTLTWVSDIAAVLQNGFSPVFVDVDPRTLGMDTEEVIRRVTPDTRAVFITHVLGFNALNDRLLEALAERGIPLIEDVSESHGATFGGKKLGTFGWLSNFSFYYAHHLSTVEGGMISTDDEESYQMLRMLRSHGLVREASSEDLRRDYRDAYPELHPEFIFAFPAYNVRGTEIQAVVGRSQLRRLDENNQRRRENLLLFLSRLDPAKYFTEFATEGSCNYALTLILRHPDPQLRTAVVTTLSELGVEFRCGTAGGGNQLRQPYLQRLLGDLDLADYPQVEQVHFYGFYIGNYPELPRRKIETLCRILNQLPHRPS